MGWGRTAVKSTETPDLPQFVFFGDEHSPWMGWGANAGWEDTGEPSAFLSVLIPDPRRFAAPGSASTIFVSGLCSLMYLPAPWKVPPVPVCCYSYISKQRKRNQRKRKRV
jgi:hypothetical protein